MKITTYCWYASLVMLLLLVSGFALAGEEKGPLPEELRGIEIQDVFIKSAGKEVGSISTITGKGRVLVVHRTEQKAFYAREKDLIYEKDALYTLGECRCRVEFRDKNVVIIAPETHLEIEEVGLNLMSGEKQSFLSMSKGKVIVYALPLFRYKDVRLDLKTPMATVGVRGTKFGAEIEKIHKTQSDTLGRMVASLDEDIAQFLPSKEDVLTRAYVFEGEIQVTSLVDGQVKRLRENEILEADRRGLGEPRLDPEKTKAFIEGVAGGLLSGPAPVTPYLDNRFHKEEAERMERLNEIKQREITPPISPHMDRSHHP